MTYPIRIKGTAVRELRRIASQDRPRIVAGIDRLTDNPTLGTSLKGGLRGLRVLPVGDFRVVNEVRRNDLVVLAVRVAHRRNAYRLNST